MKCIKCGAELTSEMFACGMCFSCGCSISESEEAFKIEQSRIKAEADLAIQQQKEEQARKSQEEQRMYAERFKNHMLTTGFWFSGYDIIEYLGLVSGEIYIAGLTWKLVSSVNSTQYDTSLSTRIKEAKKAAVEQMIHDSASLGGDGIIGISFTLNQSFDNSAMYISVNGTSIKMNKRYS